MGKQPSRLKRWQDAASRAVDALTELQEMQEQFQEWQDNLPWNLAESPVGDKLEAVCDLDIEGALDTANDADGTDLPLGFGRD